MTGYEMRPIVQLGLDSFHVNESLLISDLGPDIIPLDTVNLITTISKSLVAFLQ